jgi:hypothetical protein
MTDFSIAAGPFLAAAVLLPFGVIRLWDLAREVIR